MGRGSLVTRETAIALPIVTAASLAGKLLQNLLEGRLPENWDRYEASISAIVFGFSKCPGIVSKNDKH